MYILFRRYLNFCSNYFGHTGKGFGKSPKIDFKFLTSQTRKQRITIKILSGISRSKDNQEIKFGQLIEYNIKSIFPEKPCAKCDVETSLFYSFFYCMSKLKLIETIMRLRCTLSLVNVSYNALLEKQKKSRIIPPASFFA